MSAKSVLHLLPTAVFFQILIDDCHVEIGKGWDNLFHICQFAEMMERNGNSVIPLRNSLPLVCYGKVPEKKAIVMFVQFSVHGRTARQSGAYQAPC